MARLKRKQRNLVTMKFNVINSLLEMIGTLIVMVDNQEIMAVLYILFTSCGTPLVYYLGMEENRMKAQEHFRENIRIFKKKSKLNPKPIQK